MEWISVKDRLPEIPDIKYESVQVLVAWGSEKGNVTTMRFECAEVRGRIVKRFVWNNRISPWEVTHWMPLPDPPKQITIDHQ